jgi:PAS domain S-box-containing protein
MLEASLRQREYELEEAHRIARLGTWRWNFVTDTVSWSKEVFVTFGLDPQGPIPRHGRMQAMHTPESWERMIAAVEHIKADGTPYALDIEIQIADGARRWIHTRGEVAVRGPDGAVIEARGTVQNVTERKLTEMKLREREEELSEAHQLNKLGTWRLDVPTGKVSWSDEIFRIFGLDPNGPVPSPDVHSTLFTEESYERMITAMNRCKDEGVPYEVDGEIHAADGVTRWIAARGHVARRGERGEIMELRGTVQDVTERKRTESILRERERELLEIQRIAGVGAWRWIAATDSLTWSDELYRIFDWDPKLAPPRIIEHEALMTPESWSRTVESLQNAKDRGEPFDFESELVLPSGQARYITSIGEAVMDAGGKVVELRGTVRDMTLQKQSEDALHKANERLEAVLGGMTDGLAVRDREGRYTYFSEQAAQILGVDRDAVIGRIAWEVFPGTKETKFYCESQLALETGRPVHFEEYKPEPNPRWLECHCYPFEDGISIYFRDITLQKQSEEALRRTEKLAVTGRLAASIAHEINNPLEAVTNSLYLALQDAALSNETRLYLKMADQELTRVAQLTTQTLRFHRQSVAAEEADLSELMDSAYELFTSRFEACGIKIQREYRPGMMLFCRGDELRQVFANLLSNALDAMRHGGTLRIRIRTGHSWGRDASIGVRVVVCDSGSGIPVELRKKIFEPFVSTKADTGTGLGLWVSEGIVKKHRGRISLYSDTSATHHGTVFSIFFPLDGINADQGGDIGVQAGGLP